jgi:D-cysteine desulfhydrase
VLPVKVDLSTWPTPLEAAPRLARALGLRPEDLWIKRDDLTGLGGGGNKVRKLEYTCAAALANGSQVLVTTGAPQSNHARLTAAAGARLGLQVLLVLAGRSGAVNTGNAALNRLFGASIEWAGDLDEHELGSIAQERAEMLSARGTRAELIFKQEILMTTLSGPDRRLSENARSKHPQMAA